MLETHITVQIKAGVPYLHFVSMRMLLDKRVSVLCHLVGSL